MKKGDKYYKTLVWPEDSPILETQEYVVSQVDKRGIFLITKIQGATWVKKSKKIGDYGWAKSIPDYCRVKISKGKLPAQEGFRKSKLQARKAAIPELKKEIEEYGDPELLEIGYTEEEIEGIIRKLKSTLTKVQTEK